MSFFSILFETQFLYQSVVSIDKLSQISFTQSFINQRLTAYYQFFRLLPISFKYALRSIVCESRSDIEGADARGQQSSRYRDWQRENLLRGEADKTRPGSQRYRSGERKNNTQPLGRYTPIVRVIIPKWKRLRTRRRGCTNTQSSNTV